MEIQNRQLGTGGEARGRLDTTQQAQSQAQQQHDRELQQLRSATWEGTRSGWPSASAFRRFGFSMRQPSLRTTHGLTFSYLEINDTLEIYIHKNHRLSEHERRGNIWTEAEFNQIKQHVENAFGVTLALSDNRAYYSGRNFEKSAGRNLIVYTRLVFTFTGSSSYGDYGTPWIKITIETVERLTDQ